MNGNLMVLKAYKSNMMHEDVNNEDDDDDSKQKISGAPLSPFVHNSLPIPVPR